MNEIYRAIGTSKQAFHQRMDRLVSLLEQQAQLEVVVRKIRQDHPRMSSRQIYRMIQPECMGRDRFEQWCYQLGLKVKMKRSYQRTTNSLGVARFENLIDDLELTAINQVWVSDITYFRISERFYYLTFIMDLYSRRVVGYSVSIDLRTENTTISALNKAIWLRKQSNLRGLIFHSDGGGQYYSKAFLQITSRLGIHNSMAEDVYANPHAERINGTIKNDYLKPYDPKNFNQLVSMTKKAIRLYNDQKPHQAINHLSPNQYENQLIVN